MVGWSVAQFLKQTISTVFKGLHWNLHMISNKSKCLWQTCFFCAELCAHECVLVVHLIILNGRTSFYIQNIDSEHILVCRHTHVGMMIHTVHWCMLFMFFLQWKCVVCINGENQLCIRYPRIATQLTLANIVIPCADTRDWTLDAAAEDQCLTNRTN